MKLTDFAIVFVAIILPIVILVYVNTSFVLRAEREEMYYKSMINSAIEDATYAMKNVENNDSNIDYGYSGITNNKVSVNASVAVDTFFNSLYNNLGISGNRGSEESIKTYIPALAIIDYDGIYVYSAESDESGNTEYVLKPKKYFTYTYYIEKTYNGEYNYTVKEYNSSSKNINNNLIYQVTFTQDDYIYLKVMKNNSSGAYEDISTANGIGYINAFYLEDEENNTWLVGTTRYTGITSYKTNEIKNEIIEQLKNLRREVIAKTCMEEVSYAVNAHNYYAQKAGVSYTFSFAIASDASWYETVDGIGMLAIVQGISLGNKYLNYTAYSVSDLTVAQKYYLSSKLEKLKTTSKYYDMLANHQYYHISDECPVYQAYLKYIELEGKAKLSPSFFYSKSEAAINEFEPCYICKP